MRYHAYLQWVRMASRNFSRTAVTKTEELNKRKVELLDAQTLVLNASMEAKRKLSDAEEATFQASTKEIVDIDQNPGSLRRNREEQD